MADKNYVIDNARLMLEWDWTKNNELMLNPHTLTFGSNKKAYWICEKGHSYQAKISNRISLNRGCPYCAGRYPIVGKNDLQTLNPKLSLEWDYEKNTPLVPSDVLPNSNKKVWWKGLCGHSWQAVIRSRNKGSGCPVCAHQSVDSMNSLANINPILSKQWHPTKNGILKPENVFPNSNKKVWWVCERGHEFEATICNRNKGRGCPICKSELKTSFPEQALFFYIIKLFPDAINRYIENSMELDIYIPSIKIGIEYDGLLYHTEKQNLKRKRKTHILIIRES